MTTKEIASHRNSLRLQLSVHVVKRIGTDLSRDAEHGHIQRCFHVLSYRLLHAVHRLNDQQGVRGGGAPQLLQVHSNQRWTVVFLEHLRSVPHYRVC